MFVRSLKVSGVRNLKSTVLEPGPRFNVFAGNNGQGKTNLLEALYAVCTLRSFRTAKLRDLICLPDAQGPPAEFDSAYIAANVSKSGLARKYELTIKQRSRVVRLDEKNVRPISRYFGEFNVVLFAPEDLLVARGTPADRRKFLDRAVFTLHPEFLGMAQSYEKVLKQRNSSLRDERMSQGAKNHLLDVYDIQLAKLAASIVLARREYLQLVSESFAEAFEYITHSGLPVSLQIQPAAGLDYENIELSEIESRILQVLGQRRNGDLARGSTTVGPHRDVLQFYLAGQAAANFASQGQLRAMILAWKTAEMQLLAKIHDDPPVLLLDDVSSELDPERNAYLFDFLRQRENQCFISTTHRSFVLLDSDRVDFVVEGGQIAPA